MNDTSNGPSDNASSDLPDSSTDAEHRVENYVQDADFGWVASSLTECRDDILSSWLEAAAEQSFHKGRRERAVADHIPALLDAVTDLLKTSIPRWVDPYAPMDNDAVLAAAQAHARMRAEQGLRPTDVVVEFRLLRQEVWRAMRAVVPDSAPSSDVIGAQMMVNDAIDGAITLALVAYTEQIEQLREEFLAFSMHEVLQPLTILMGQARLAEIYLSKSPPDVSSALPATAHIRAAGQRMTSMLKMLSAASRVVLGSLELQPAEVDLVAILNKAIRGLGPEAQKRVSLKQSPGINTVGQWDAEQLERVFVNLLSNAAKYSPEGSPIEVSLYAGTKGTKDSGQEAIKVSIRDYGIGIPAQDLPKLFRRYVRAENAISGGTEGFGLGLYMSKGIVEAHGGTILATSEGPNAGTTMLVTLPKQPPPQLQVISPLC
jgi:signal transduction histidine kinase